MFSVLKKVFGGIVVVSVVISSCFGESDEGSALIKECLSIEECVNRLAGRPNQRDIRKECEIGDKKACKIVELTDKMWKKCSSFELSEENMQFCMEVARRFNSEQYYHTVCLNDNLEACIKIGKYVFACKELNHADTCYKLAKKQVVDTSDNSSRNGLTDSFYDKACELKIGVACNDIGVAYENGKGAARKYGASKNYVTAKSYYDKACELGDKKGCENAKRLAKEKGL